MKAEARRKLEMAGRALEFSQAHLDDSEGYRVALQQLEEQVALSEQLVDQQREGMVDVRAATARKRDLIRAMRRRQLVHVARVAQRAAGELPELAQKFDLPRLPIPHLAFISGVRTMAAEARRHKELLIRHGLVERILDGLEQSLDQFDRAVAQSSEGRRVHIGAGAHLDSLANDMVQLVKVIDGANRDRFADDRDLMAAWKSASKVVVPRRGSGLRVINGAAVDPAA
jgi:hypothetical protein